MTESSSSPPSPSTATTLALSSAVAIAAATAYFYRYKTRAQQKADSIILESIPWRAPGAHWLLGHLPLLHGDGDFQRGYHTVYVEHSDPATGLCSLWFLSRPSLSVILGEHVKAILNASSFRLQMPFLEEHMHQFLGREALVVLMGKEWKRYRTAVHKSINAKTSLSAAQPKIHQVGNTLVESLLKRMQQSTDDKQIQLAILPLMKMATMDVFGLVALDIDFGCTQQLQLTPVAHAFEYLTSEYTRRLSTPWNPAIWLYWLPTPANRKHKAQRRVIRDFIAQQIEQTRDQTADSNKRSATVLSNIVKTADTDRISDDAIGDIIMTLLFGGYDTTSITLTYTLYLLAQHPKIEKECVQEVQSVLQTKSTNNVSEDDLPYTKAVVMETLRLYPPAPVTARALEKDMTLDGYHIQKGTNVLVPIWSIQRDGRNFEQPLQFLPERWVRKQSTGWEERPSTDDTSAASSIPPANRDAWCVFSAGARNCVGKQLAMQEAVTLLAILISELKFEIIDQAKPRLASVVQQPEDGLPMTIRAR